MSLYEQEALMPPHNRPRPGQGWRPPPPRTSHRPDGQQSARYRAGTGTNDTELMADLDALVALGLIVPIRDGQAIRLAINPAAEGDPSYE